MVPDRRRRRVGQAASIPLWIDETARLRAELPGDIRKVLGIRGSEWIVFEESSHMAFAEEPERFVSVLDEFLRRVESAPA